MKKIGTLAFLLLAFNLTKSQSDSLHPSEKFVYSLGICGTFDFFDTHTGDAWDSRGYYENPSSILLSGSASLKYCKIKSNHFMLETGVEYNAARYYVSQTTRSDDMDGTFANLHLLVNTVSVPVYWNLLLFHQKMYLGTGLYGAVIPFAIARGHDDVENKNFKARLGYVRNFDFGGAIKIGGFVNIFHKEFMIEAKANLGVLNLTPHQKLISDNFLQNNFVVISVGKVFKKL